ncbi:MAG: helix-turn-helix domain-containing protein [Candidatus Omnitrophica bacterium]|nr:helix-turn-helix domain-containing protein [Candidatus Omnitrophota bacterium]
MKIEKYFWDLNEKALKDTKEILKSAENPKFSQRMVTFLSRCDQPKLVFSVISKEDFIKSWPLIRTYWLKVARKSEFRDWWETIYEQLAQEKKGRKISPKGGISDLFKGVGEQIRQARISNGLSQRDLSLLSGIKQPDISKIEEGKKNITLTTLSRFCKVLHIKSINLFTKESVA